MAVFKDYYMYGNGQMLFRGDQRVWRGLRQQQRPSLEFRKFTASPPRPHPKAAGGPAEPQGVLSPLEIFWTMLLSWLVSSIGFDI